MIVSPFTTRFNVLSCSPPMVQLLLDAYPDGAKAANNDGHLPLHDAAYWNASPAVLNMLVDIHPDRVVATTNSGELPINLAEEAYRLAGDPSHENTEIVESLKVLLRLILNNKEALLLGYLDKTPLHIAARFDVLNLRTCVTIERCPAEVVMTVARRHPDQLRKRDGDGNYPLHLVASNPYLNGARVSSPAPCGGESRDDGDEEGVEDGDDGGDEGGGEEDSVESDEASVGGSGEASDDAEVEKDLIGELVKLYPQAAAAPNADGRSPLCLAIESGKRWDEGVEAIADAAKHVVIVRDEATGLYPFMLAAAGGDPCLSTVFGLLRRCPELKRYILH